MLPSLLAAGVAVLHPRMKDLADRDHRCRLIDALLEQFLASSSALFNNSPSASVLTDLPFSFSQTYPAPVADLAPVGQPQRNAAR